MAAHRSTTSVRTDWVRACIVGELFGFVPPAVTGAGLYVLDAPEGVMVVGLVLAGIVEGIVLGYSQSRVLIRYLPAATGWVTATATAAGLAWLAGMGGSSLVQAAGPIALVIAVPGWIIGLLSMGWLQARCLRKVTAQHRRWIPVTTLAWLVGVMIPVVALSVLPNSWSTVVHVIVAVAAAVAMGAAVGLITGKELVRLVDGPWDLSP